jgi:hypothetical protein
MISASQKIYLEVTSTYLVRIFGEEITFVAQEEVDIS